MTTTGCIWSGTKAGGLENTRTGNNDAISCVKTAATGVKEGVEYHSIAAGDWLDTATSPCLPNVIGLSWRWDWRNPAGEGATYQRSTFPTKAALMYTRRDLDRQAYAIEVHSAGGILGTPYNCGLEGQFFSYRLSNHNWEKVVDINNPLFFMGVVFQYLTNQGGSSTPYLLASTVWDAVPVVTSRVANKSLYTNWNDNPDPLYMTVKQKHNLARLNSSDPERMNALQTG